MVNFVVNLLTVKIWLLIVLSPYIVSKVFYRFYTCSVKKRLTHYILRSVCFCASSPALTAALVGWMGERTSRRRARRQRRRPTRAQMHNCSRSSRCLVVVDAERRRDAEDVVAGKLIGPQGLCG